MVSRLTRCAGFGRPARWAASVLLLALIAHASPGWSCSLSFTTPARGSTVTSATVGVAGTGSGTANAGDVGTVTATVNGQVFFSQSGRFTTLIQFLGSGAASVTLRPGPNVLQVSGSAGSCSASDQMVVHYTPPPPAAQKAAGAPLVCNGSNPIDGGNGNKFQTERDYTGAGPFPLVFERYYNSQFDSNGTLGPRWRHGYDRRIAATTATAYVFRPDGRALRFGSSGETWFADADVVERLVRLKDDAGKPVGWQFVDADDTVEAYDNSGRLTLITLRGGLSQSLAYDTSGRLVAVTEVPFGRRLAFTYDASNRLESVADPADGIIRFNYDGAGRLISAAYPDSTPEDASDNPVRQYLYEDPRFPLALTGLLDENAERFATWAYGADGRAISSEHAGGVDRYRFTYDAGGGSTVTDPLGAVRTYNYATVLGVPRATGVSQPCTAGCGSQSATV
ncbi:MAG: RHS repeat protein, partial [Gammaproteobacteria bacterium]|nr:RHS repeat protein [Gammaproteobacteria bacterium]